MLKLKMFIRQLQQSPYKQIQEEKSRDNLGLHYSAPEPPIIPPILTALLAVIFILLVAIISLIVMLIQQPSDNRCARQLSIYCQFLDFMNG
jgi:hypothetical protein